MNETCEACGVPVGQDNPIAASSATRFVLGENVLNVLCFPCFAKGAVWAAKQALAEKPTVVGNVVILQLPPPSPIQYSDQT